MIEQKASSLNENDEVLTTIVRIKGSNLYNVVSVKSSKPINKKLWIDCSKALSRIHVGPPLRIGDVVCKNILNTRIDIICTRNIEVNNIEENN